VTRNKTPERWLQRQRAYRNASLRMKLTLRRKFHATITAIVDDRIQRIVQSLASMAAAADKTAEAMASAARAFRELQA
jgi:hypothetical protein